MNSCFSFFPMCLGIFLNMKYLSFHHVTSPCFAAVLCCMKHDQILINRCFFPPTFWVNICSVVFSKTVLLKTYYWDASLFVFSRVVLFCGCNHCHVFLSVIVCVCVCVYLSIWNSFQNQILLWCSWVEVASCQFGIIDMIQLQEVTATLCIFKGPQWGTSAVGFWPLTPFILWWGMSWYRHDLFWSVSESDTVCSQNQICIMVLPKRTLSPIAYGYCFPYVQNRF